MVCPGRTAAAGVWAVPVMQRDLGLSIGQAGGILGGVISDGIMRKSKSLTLARKTPIVVGMLLSLAFHLLDRLGLTNEPIEP